MAYTSIPYNNPPPPPPLPIVPSVINTTEPADIQVFLSDRGWTFTYGDDRQWYQHRTDVQHLYYTWSEAIAYEMYRFMNLGS